MSEAAGDEVFEMGGHPFRVAVDHDATRPEAETWQAVSEELGGCRGAGPTRDAALESLRGAIVRYVASDLLDP